MTTQRWNDEMLDEFAELTKRNLNELSELTKRNAEAIDKLTADIDKQREESKEQTLKFTYYQQATQWVVQLAFGLLATATVTTIIAAVFRK